MGHSRERGSYVVGHSRETGKFRVKFFPCCIATYCLDIVFEEWYSE